MGRLTVDDVDDMFSDLWDTDAIIFDQRNYPNMTLWTIVNYLYSSPINISNYTYPDITYPGVLKWQSDYIGSGNPQPYEGNVRILMDEETQSQAEYTCMGLEQHPGAYKIGSTTSGGDGNASDVFLPGKISTFFSGLGIYYPDYTQTQRVGIIPDFEVHPTIAGIRAGIDEVLAFALECYVGDQEVDIAGNIQLYPNPFRDKIFYEYTQTDNNQKIQIEVFDLYGRIVYRFNAYPHYGEINLSALPSGAYILKFTSGNHTMIKKVIRQ
jgi:hypothetical protein